MLALTVESHVEARTLHEAKGSETTQSASDRLLLSRWYCDFISEQK
jgi:hypothetical protein